MPTPQSASGHNQGGPGTFLFGGKVAPPRSQVKFQKHFLFLFRSRNMLQI